MSIFFQGLSGTAEGESIKPPPVHLPMIEDPQDRAFYEWYCRALRIEFRTKVKETQSLMFISNRFLRPKRQLDGCASMLMECMIWLATRENDIGRCMVLASSMALKTGIYESFGFRTV